MQSSPTPPRGLKYMSFSASFCWGFLLLYLPFLAWEWEWSWKMHRASPTFFQFPDGLTALAQTIILLYSRICLAIRCLAKSDLKNCLRQKWWLISWWFIFISNGYQSVSIKSPTKKQIQLQQLFENTSKTWISPDVSWNDTMETPPVFSMCSSRV